MLITKSVFVRIHAIEIYCSMFSFGLHHCKAVIVCSTGDGQNGSKVIENNVFGWMTSPLCVYLCNFFFNVPSLNLPGLCPSLDEATIANIINVSVIFFLIID